MGKKEKMNKSRALKVIRYNLRAKMFIIIMVSFVVVVVGTLFWKGNNGGRIGGGIFLLFFIWLLLRSSKVLPLFIKPFRAAFIIYPDGIEFVSEEVFIEWEQIEEIVVFSYEGEKHFGFRLREDITALQGRNIEECMKGNVSWSAFKMPFATMHKMLSTAGSDIVEMLSSQYGLKVRSNNKEIEAGNENEI